MAAVVSLQKQCMVFIACHVEHFSPNTIARLPIPLQTQLVRSLPVADVCALEDTILTQTVDFESIWEKLCMQHTTPHSFPEEHFQSVYQYESMKDYFFTYIWHLVMTEQTPIAMQVPFSSSYRNFQRNNTQRSIVQTVLNSGTTTEGYQNFCSILLSMQSAADIESNDSVYQTLLHFPSVLTEPYIPSRYMPCYINEKGWQMSNVLKTSETRQLRISFPNMPLVVTMTCNYLPQALQLNMRDFLRTMLWQRSNSWEAGQLFARLRYMHLIVHRDLCSSDEVESANRFLREVISNALLSLHQLRIKFEDSLTFSVFAPKIFSVIVECMTNCSTEIQTIALSFKRKSACVQSNDNELSIFCEDDLFKFLGFFQKPYFQSLILEGMAFASESIVPKIISTFLTVHCKSKQRLVFSKVEFKTNQKVIFPKFTLPTCAHKHKELKFHAMTIQPQFLEKLLNKPGLQLRLLEILLEPWHYCDYSADFSKNDSVDESNKLALELCAMNPGLQVAQLRFHVHLMSSPIMQENFERMFRLRALESLDLTCCNMGPGGLATALCNGLSIQKHKPGSLKEINLSRNNLSKVPEATLCNLFNKLFELPNLPHTKLDLSYNGFNSHQFTMLHSAWNRMTKLKVGFLGFAKNCYANEHFISTMALEYDISQQLVAK